MEVKQIYQLVNNATSEVLGSTALVSEDLQNLVDIGTQVFNQNAVDAYVRSLVNHIGKVVFVNRTYTGSAPSVLMDGWEYGSVLEKITADLPTATENEDWTLTDGTSYDPNIFYKPTVSAKFFNKKVTFEIPMSFTQMQVKQSFSSAEQMNGFLSMLQNAVEKAMTVNLDNLIMRTINNMIGETVYDALPSGTYTGAGGIRCVNLLYDYNQLVGSANAITVAEALTTPEFIRYASYVMGMYQSRIGKISKLFNIGGKDRFTPSDMLHTIYLADFAKSADIYLQSDTFHNDFVKLPNAEVVPFWQGSGTSYAFSDVSKIKITTASNHAIEFGGILGVMFDRDALGVTNLDRRVTTNFNPKAEFYSNWYKFDAGYFNDTNENFVVFYINAVAG